MVERSYARQCALAAHKILLVRGQTTAPWTRWQVLLRGLGFAFSAVAVGLLFVAGAWATYFAAEAVVGGHRLSNSTALLSQALAVAEKAAGGPMSDQKPSPAGSGAEPNSCAYLRSASGGFLGLVACGGATTPRYFVEHPFTNRPTYPFIWELRLKARAAKGGGYVGALASAPFQAVRAPEVAPGDELWRPDGSDGEVVTGMGDIGTTFYPSGKDISGVPVALVVVLGAACAVALATFGFLLRSRRRSNDPRRLAVAAAGSAWGSLTALLDAPPVTPPSPVLITPGRALPAPPEAASARSEAWEALVSQPSTTEAVEQVAQADPTLFGAQPAPPEVSPSAPAPGEVPKVYVKVLGPVGTDGLAEPPARPKTTELLVYLALHRGRPVSTERLRTALWPYQPDKPDVSAETVHEEMSRVRRCVGAENFPRAREGGYQLAEGVETDWERFSALTEAASALPEERGLEVLEEALSLVRGQVLDGVAKAYSWAWEDFTVANLEAAVAKAAHLMSARCLALGRTEEAKWAVGQGLRACRADEAVWEDALAVAVARGGRAALDRAFKEAEEACGPQPPGTVLFEAYRRLRDGSA